MQTPCEPSRLTALVADSSPYGARIVREALAKAGVRRVIEARDGAEALERLAEGRADLLVLDWELPVIAAAEIVAIARDATRSHAPSMPVAVIMPEPTRKAVEAAIAAKVDSILATPFSPGEFGRRLRPLIRRAEAGARA